VRDALAGAELADELLEREDDVVDLLAVSRLLDIGDLAPAAIGDPRLGDLVVADRVCGTDVLGPDDAAYFEIADLEIHPDLLPAGDHHIAVGQELRDDGGDLEFDILVARHAPGAVVARQTVQIDEVPRADLFGEQLGHLRFVTEEARGPGILGRGPTALGGVLISPLSWISMTAVRMSPTELAR